MQKATARAAVFTTAILAVAFCLPTFAYADYTITTSVNTNSGGSFGRITPNFERFAQSFTTIGSEDIDSLDVRLDTVTGTPSDLYFTIEGDVSSAPSGSPLLTSNNIAYTSITNCSATVHVTFPSTYTVSASTKYWVVAHQVTPNNSNYYAQCGDVDDYASGNRARYDGSWNTLGGDWSMTISLITTGTGGGGATTSTATSTADEVSAITLVTFSTFAVFLATFVSSIWIYKTLL